MKKYNIAFLPNILDYGVLMIVSFPYVNVQLSFVKQLASFDAYTKFMSGIHPLLDAPSFAIKYHSILLGLCV